MENNKKYILGLDLGVASIGWAAMEINEEGEPIKLLDANSVIFTSLDNDNGKLYNVERREKRGSRRVKRRRVNRIKTIKKFIIDNNILKEIELKNLFKGTLEDIYSIRLKGLKEQLSNFEIARLMIYYAKNRGFKSNKKSEDNLIKKIDFKKETKEENNEKKLKLAIAKSIKYIEEGGLSPVEVINKIREGNNILKFRNESGVYKFGFTRKQIETEVREIFMNQNILTNEIVEEYLKIWGSQRDFSDGPGGDSEYKVDYRDISGKCIYTGEIRAVKASPSSEIFVLLQKLNDIRYYEEVEGNYKNEYKKLSVDNIKNILLKAQNGKKINYELLSKELNGQNIKFKDLPDLPKSKWKEYREKIQDIEEFNKKIFNERMKIEILKDGLKNLKKLKVEFKNNGISNEKIEELGGIDFLDKVAELLTYSKTDNKLIKYIENDDRYKLLSNTDIIEAMKNMSTYSGNMNLSLTAIKKLNSKMLEGKDYYESRKDLGYFNDKEVYWEKFPTISEIEDAFNTSITNVNVKHVLVQLRKLYNALLEKFGKPSKVHIELAREMSKDFSERQKIKNKQLERYNEKQIAKFELFSANKDIINKNDLSNESFLRFNLWKEQDYKCIYSGKYIPREKVLSYELEVDHILPYSRTRNNSYFNKALVYKEENQNKKEKTPFEWLGNNELKWKEFKNRVENLKITEIKKRNLLRKDSVEVEGFLERELHATSYVSRLSYTIFDKMIDPSEKYLVNEDGSIKEERYNDNVVAYNGSITSQLRKSYGLNKFTHNLENSNLIRDVNYRLNDIKIEINDKDNKYTLIFEIYDEIFRIYSEIKYTTNYNKKDKMFKTNKDESMYRFIVKLLENEKFYSEFKDIVFNWKLEKISKNDINSLNIKFENELLEDEVIDDNVKAVIWGLLSDVKNRVNIKNRDNHLHHALDATLLTIMNKKMQNKLLKYNQLLMKKSNKDEKLEDEINKLLIDGVVEEKESDGLKFNIYNKEIKLCLKYPYLDFENDILKIIFDKINGKLPYHVPVKNTKGALHAETILGESKGKITKRISISKLKLKKDKIEEEIFDKEGSQKEVYEVLFKWLKDKKSYTPILKNGNIIKKVKIVVSDKVIKIGNKRYVEMGQTTTKILVFRKKDKKGENKLYFSSLGRFHYNQMLKGEDINISLFPNKEKNGIKYSELKDKGYEKYLEIKPYNCYKIKFKDKREVKCKITGYTSTKGLLEIKSIIGDGLDLIKKGIIRDKKGRFRTGVNKIVSIEELKYDILGD